MDGVGEWAVFLRWVVGAILLAAAVAKVTMRADFDGLVDALGLPASIRPLASGLPVVEAVIAGALLVELLPLVAAIAAALLALSFVAVQLVGAVRGSPPCNCFGRLDMAMPAALTLVRSLLLAAAAIPLVVLEAVAEPHGKLAGLPAVIGTAAGLGILAGIGLLAEVWQFEKRHPRRLRRPAVVDGIEPSVIGLSGASR
jgi:hypothetical protein